MLKSWRSTSFRDYPLDAKRTADQQIAVFENRGDTPEGVPDAAVIWENPSFTQFPRQPVETNILITSTQDAWEVVQSKYLWGLKREAVSYLSAGDLFVKTIGRGQANQTLP